ncbi:aminotransferase class I and II [Fibrisoma limi BUZ 3]|uniref:Aminotransferase class I and II n=1 Tax=Fibrisoma limi BUZ 3 TaxID=1185876 RepID=I2GPL5_9BACT|nr:aminotransferase class I/II-fold pyridoxal phosphate-dependent enzyme [Fibrisoma limi]CCH55843.1 aminotransferase class I and II [Fibrisoma limi BUZ 3]
MSTTFTVDHLPGRTIRHEGRHYLFFSGTSYLGLPQSIAFQQLLTESIGCYGTSFGSSRNGNLQLQVYQDAEAKLAAFVGAETALTLSSGMMAGQAVVNYLRAQRYEFVYGPHTHPALWHEPDLIPPAVSFAEWADQLPNVVATADRVAIVLNSLDAVRSQAYLFDWVRQLPAEQPITLVVDDSHGLGVIGEEGSGIWRQIPQIPSIRLVVTASLAKAMGLPGGVILGDANTLGSIRRTPFFGGCSPIPPAYLSAYLKGDELYQQGWQKLQRNVALAEELLLPTGLFTHAPGYPVFYTERDELYPYLLEKGIFLYSFAYPTAADRANTRVVISAFHESEDIERLAGHVNEFIR